MHCVRFSLFVTLLATRIKNVMKALVVFFFFKKLTDFFFTKESGREGGIVFTSRTPKRKVKAHSLHQVIRVHKHTDFLFRIGLSSHTSVDIN